MKIGIKDTPNSPQIPSPKLTDASSNTDTIDVSEINNELIPVSIINMVDVSTEVEQIISDTKSTNTENNNSVDKSTFMNGSKSDAGDEMLLLRKRLKAAESVINSYNSSVLFKIYYLRTMYKYCLG